MINNLREMAWEKLLLAAIVIVAGIAGACFLIYSLLEAGNLNPVVLLILAALISIALPMLRSNFFPSARDCETEYDFHEKRLEEQIHRRIDDTLNQGTFDRIFSPDGQFCDSAGDFLSRLLGEEEVHRNKELQFFLRMILARFYEKHGDPHASIEQLTQALEIDPHHFIVNFRLAANYEWIGAVDNAARHYRRALLDSGGVSRGMRKLTAAHIQRLNSGAGQGGESP